MKLPKMTGKKLNEGSTVLRTARIELASKHKAGTCTATAFVSGNFTNKSKCTPSSKRLSQHANKSNDETGNSLCASAKSLLAEALRRNKDTAFCASHLSCSYNWEYD